MKLNFKCIIIVSFLLGRVAYSQRADSNSEICFRSREWLITSFEPWNPKDPALAIGSYSSEYYSENSKIELYLLLGKDDKTMNLQGVLIQQDDQFSQLKAELLEVVVTASSKQDLAQSKKPVLAKIFILADDNWACGVLYKGKFYERK